MVDPALRFSREVETTRPTSHVIRQAPVGRRREVRSPSTLLSALISTRTISSWGSRSATAQHRLLAALRHQGAVEIAEWHLLFSAVNEILHGPAAIKEWKHHTRTGWPQDDAVAFHRRESPSSATSSPVRHVSP